MILCESDPYTAVHTSCITTLAHVVTSELPECRTTSWDVQRAIEDSTEKRTKDTYGPPVGKKLIIFLDDLNMPKVDIYGTQQPIALLKLFIERQGVYDRGKELNWKHMKDIQVCISPFLLTTLCAGLRAFSL